MKIIIDIDENIGRSFSSEKYLKIFLGDILSSFIFNKGGYAQSSVYRYPKEPIRMGSRYEEVDLYYLKNPEYLSVRMEVFKEDEVNNGKVK